MSRAATRLDHPSLWTRIHAYEITSNLAYGVLFHLTGDVKALELAKDGAYYLIDQLQDTENGGFISFTEDDKPGLKWTQRTSQDQAYALVGLAMYYYLTRDPKVEKALIEQQAFIFDKYKLNDDVGLAGY